MGSGVKLTTANVTKGVRKNEMVSHMASVCQHLQGPCTGNRTPKHEWVCAGWILLLVGE